MSILWFIIKMILFILLGILLLGIILIGVVLLAPIRYEAYFAKYEEMAYEVKVRYLWGIRALFVLQDGMKVHRVSLFGKKIYDIHEELKENDEMPEEVSKEKHEAYATKVAKVHDCGRKQEKSSSETISDKNRIAPREEIKNGQRTVKEVKASKSDEKTIHKKNNMRKQEKKLPKEEYCQKEKEIDFKEVLSDPLTYRAIKRMILGIWKVLKVIAPREWDFEVIVGKDDPADTGELIAKLTMLYPLYYQHGIIRGDYEQACLKGGFLITGKFRLIQITDELVRVYFNKDVNALVHLIKK